MAACEILPAPASAPEALCELAERLARAMPPTETWPLERNLALARMYARGLSYTLIGRELGISKSAAISKSHGMGLPIRGSNGGPELKLRVAAGLALKSRARTRPARPPRPPRPVKAQRIPTPDEAAREAALALSATEPDLARLDAQRQCRWPIGDPKSADFGFCGRLKTPERPYCAAHAAVAVDHDRTAKAQRGKAVRGILRVAQHNDAFSLEACA